MQSFLRKTIQGSPYFSCAPLRFRVARSLEHRASHDADRPPVESPRVNRAHQCPMLDEISRQMRYAQPSQYATRWGRTFPLISTLTFVGRTEPRCERRTTGVVSPSVSYRSSSPCALVEASRNVSPPEQHRLWRTRRNRVPPRADTYSRAWSLSSISVRLILRRPRRTYS
jgi:hypothetical protein